MELYATTDVLVCWLSLLFLSPEFAAYPGSSPAGSNFFSSSPLMIGIEAEFQLLFAGSLSGTSSSGGDYQYKGSAGREIDPGLEAGRRYRALPGISSVSSP